MLNKSTPQHEIETASAASAASGNEPTLPDEEGSSDTAMEVIGRLMHDAEISGNASEYRSADSLFRKIIYLINANSEQAVQDSTLPIDSCINKIVDFYSQSMPDTFPVPDEIAPEVFQRRILQSLDSLEITREDSVLVAGFSDRSGIVYDVPMVWNSRVQRALFYHITRNKRTIESWKVRSGTYLSFMKKMFADSGMPQDLAYLPLIESGFNPKAYSRSHASGIWQFIGSTGKLYGLRSSYWIDERRDPVRSTNAAIRYLKKLYNDFGHWHLALAAYNCGENGVARTIDKCGSNDYWQLRLPSETMNYVPLYLASLAIAKSPDFNGTAATIAGADAVAKHDTIPFDTVTVGDCLDMRDIANGTGIAYDTLKKLNPHILHWCTPPDMTGVLLYLPPGTAAAFNNFYASLPDEKKVKWYRYRVQPGDNLGSIARYFRLPVEGIKSVNRLRGTRIIAGHYLFIPIPVNDPDYRIPPQENETVRKAAPTADVPVNAKLTVYEVKPGDTVWRLADIFGISASQICGWNNLVDAQIKVGQILSIYTNNQPETVEPQPKPSARNRETAVTGRYAARQGDTAFRIARQFSMTVDELCALNGLNPQSPDIHPGDTLRVTNPAGTGPVSLLVRQRPQSTHQDAIIYIISPGDNLFRIAQNFSVTVDQIRGFNNLSASAAIRTGDTLFIPKPTDSERKITETALKEIVYYTVKSGDNLWRIANAFRIPVERLYEYNNLQATSVLMPGDTIMVLRNGEM